MANMGSTEDFNEQGDLERKANELIEWTAL